MKGVNKSRIHQNKGLMSHRRRGLVDLNDLTGLFGPQDNLGPTRPYKRGVRPNEAL